MYGIACLSVSHNPSLSCISCVSRYVVSFLHMSYFIALYVCTDASYRLLVYALLVWILHPVLVNACDVLEQTLHWACFHSCSSALEAGVIGMRIIPCAESLQRPQNGLDQLPSYVENSAVEWINIVLTVSPLRPQDFMYSPRRCVDATPQTSVCRLFSSCKPCVQ
jgi:hypothetical protein